GTALLVPGGTTLLALPPAAAGPSPPDALPAMSQTAAKASSRMDRPSSSRSSPITSGGRNLITLPNVPQVSVTSPAWWQALATAAVVAGSGSSVPGLVSSIASIGPRPRRLAVTGYFS